MEEEKIKEQVLQDEIQNEILVAGVTEPAKVELVGEQKKKQWEKCVEGLARHRAIKKQQMEEEKKRKAEEKMLLKQKIRQELERQKLIDETKKEMEKDKLKDEKVEPVQEKALVIQETIPVPTKLLEMEEFEKFLEWKKRKNVRKEVSSESDSEEEKKRKKKKSKRIKKKKIESSSSESDSEEDESDFIPNPCYQKTNVEEEEVEEQIAKLRAKAAKKLPPKANIPRQEFQASSMKQQTDSQLLYNKIAPGKYFYL
jgi:hypothetical protein